MPATMPASDLSGAPDDWLQAVAALLDEDDAGEEKFAHQIEAIYKMREIARREGRNWHAPFEEVKAELIRRGLREPDPEPEFMTRSAAVAAIREKCQNRKLQHARFFADLLPSWTEDGRKWTISLGRRWHRISDVEALLRDLSS